MEQVKFTAGETEAEVEKLDFLGWLSMWLIISSDWHLYGTAEAQAAITVHF